jgi:hypothetical protein
VGFCLTLRDVLSILDEFSSGFNFVYSSRNQVGSGMAKAAAAQRRPFGGRRPSVLETHHCAMFRTVKFRSMPRLCLIFCTESIPIILFWPSGCCSQCFQIKTVNAQVPGTPGQKSIARRFKQFEADVPEKTEAFSLSTFVFNHGPVLRSSRHTYLSMNRTLCIEFYMYVHTTVYMYVHTTFIHLQT